MVYNDLKHRTNLLIILCNKFKFGSKYFLLFTIYKQIDFDWRWNKVLCSSFECAFAPLLNFGWKSLIRRENAQNYIWTWIKLGWAYIFLNYKSQNRVTLKNWKVSPFSFICNVLYFKPPKIIQKYLHRFKFIKIGFLTNRQVCSLQIQN